MPSNRQANKPRMLAGTVISRPIFAAFLDCETKAYLLQQGILARIMQRRLLSPICNVGASTFG